MVDKVTPLPWVKAYAKVQAAQCIKILRRGTILHEEVFKRIEEAAQQAALECLSSLPAEYRLVRMKQVGLARIAEEEDG
jgi:hypothetical protein